MLKRLRNFITNLFDFIRHYYEFADSDAESETHILHEP